MGSYHFVFGVDASSPATFSAYLNSLTYMLGNPKANPWKLTSGTYCCFNAFSRVDVRVEVKIPGGVESYIVDLKGERHSITNNNAIWQETYVSAILRAIHDDQNKPGSAPLLGLRKLDPMPTIKSERRFLDAASAEFFKGWQLGCSMEVQVPTLCSNHLTTGVVKYFKDAGRLAEAANFLQPLFKEDLEVGAVLAQAYIGCDEELKAVKVMHEASKKFPVPYELLLVQADFLASKKQHDKSLRLAKLAATRAPSEFVVWEKLVQIFMELEDYESALLALNTCPMLTASEADEHKLPAPARTHLPLKLNGQDPSYDAKTAPNNHGTLQESNDPKEHGVHPELLRLPSAALEGTFRRAYLLLTKLCVKTGWESLLQIRSKVFVMEDEYRIHRAMAEEEAQATAGKMEDEVDEPVSEMENISLDDGNKAATPKKKGKLSIDELMKKASNNPNLNTAFEQQQPANSKTSAKPNKPRLPFTGVNFSFKHKRLCEKWLDNLFMVLYSDLRIYSGLKGEMMAYVEELKHASENATASTTSLRYTSRRTGAEWEILGHLALRLHATQDAKLAFALCADQMLSTSAILSLIKIYSSEGNINPCLEQIVRMVTCLDNTFSEETYPSPIATGLFLLIHTHGLTKVQNALVAMNVSSACYKHITYASAC
ncbi:hypothetical protein HDU91_002722 [Kappamyces sp. JEL0680]|nr:hypothetical protein HDU91_002722 [Kappamyces sp. JEL0680]